MTLVCSLRHPRTSGRRRGVWSDREAVPAVPLARAGSSECTRSCVVSLIEMEWSVSVLGLLVVAIALRDIFHTLWHPSGFGSIAGTTFRMVWFLSRHALPRGKRSLAGPTGVLVTVAVWTGLVVAGWVLVYWPHMPEGFYFGSPLKPQDSSDFLAALYFSLVTVATLGFGDITPADPVLRLLTPLQALLGFVLLTAAISWVLQIYPALGRRRALARRLNILRAREAAGVLATGDPAVASRVLDSVTAGVIEAETDFLQYAESYYFVEEERGLSLAAALPYAVEIARAGQQARSREVRLAAGVLADAVEALARRLDSLYLKRGGGVADVLAAYSADHGQRVEPVS